MILKLGLKPKIPDQRKQLDCSEFMFRNKPKHIAGNKCKQEPDAIVLLWKKGQISISFQTPHTYTHVSSIWKELKDVQQDWELLIAYWDTLTGMIILILILSSGVKMVSWYATYIFCWIISTVSIDGTHPPPATNAL